MPVTHSIWQIGQEPQELRPAQMETEQLLEDMIVAAPGILSDDWMIIGRQAPTTSGKRIDLLAIAPDASLVLIELKRERTAREVVAQALDYASWVEGLEGEDLEAIYGRFKEGASLKTDCQQRFRTDLDESQLNGCRLILIGDDVSAAWHGRDRVQIISAKQAAESHFAHLKREINQEFDSKIFRG